MQRIWHIVLFSMSRKGLCYLRLSSSGGSWLGPRLGRAPQLAATPSLARRSGMARAYEKDQ